MKRILFVDDDAAILNGLRNIFRKHRKIWDMRFAEGGEAALALLREQPADVIVSDMRMPGMDGGTLLHHVREEFPGIVRLILSGHAEREAMIRAVPVAHQFLAKPCDPDVLHNVIQRACELQDLINDDALRALMGGIASLPSPPKIYWQLTAALADPSVPIDTVAGIIEQDPALAAKVLQLVNSSYFGIAKPVSAVGHAVGYLGFELIRGLVLTAHILRTFDDVPPIPGFDLGHLQAYALVTAKVARRLLPRGDASEQAFTAALLHDLGKLVIAVAFPDRFAEVLRSAESAERPFYAAEHEVFGFGHAEVGAYLLGLWGLPNPIVEAVAYHHTPVRVAQRGFELVGVVHVADVLVDACLSPLTGITCSRTQLDLAYLETLGVAARLPTWRAIAEEEARAWFVQA